MLFVQQLQTDSDEPVEVTDVSQVESAVARLDGMHRTLVVLKGNASEAHMAIGGGDGNYVVYTTEDNQRFFMLINPDAVPGRVSMVCGGQRGEFEAEKCVGRPAMLHAVRTYVVSGERDKALRWSKS